MKKIPIARAQMGADILRWRVLERAQSAASSCKQVTSEEGEKKKDSHVRKGTHSHCMRTKVKKYILVASWRRSSVK